MKAIFERAKEVILNPKDTWQTIKGETQSVQALLINYAAPLALIPTVAALIGFTVIGIRMPSGQAVRAPFVESLLASAVGYVFNLLGLLVGAWVVNVLAPYFNSKADFNSAAKLVVYSMTPIWLLGVFSILPALGILQILGLYGLYLLYLGLPVLMGTPAEKVLLYTIAIIVAGILISVILSAVVGGAIYGPMFMRMMAV